MTRWNLFQEHKVGSKNKNQPMWYDILKKDKNNMIFSEDTEKDLKKMQYSCKIKTLSKLRREGTNSI